MSGKPPTTSRRTWVWRQLGTFCVFFLGVNFTAGWAKVLLDDEQTFWWWTYPMLAASSFWGGVQRLIDDATQQAEDR